MASWWEQLKALAAQGSRAATELSTAPVRAIQSWIPNEIEHNLMGFSRNQPPFRPTQRAESTPRQATSASLGRAPEPTDEADLFGDLFAKFLRMLEADVPPSTNFSGQIDPVYDARISALQNLMERAENRVGEGKQEIGDMYDLLAQNYEKLAPEARAQARESEQDVDKLFGELRSTVEGTYTKVAKDQADLFRQLGIEAASPDVLGAQGEQQAEAMNRASELGAINKQRAADIGNIDESYYRQGAPLARLAGANRQSDLMTQLENYLTDVSNQINAANAERSAAHSQLAAQAQREARQQEQQQMQMLWEILQSQFQGQAIEMTPEIFLQQLPSDLRSEVSGAYRQIERSNPVLTNQVQGRIPGTSVATPDEYWLELAQIMYDNGDLSPQAFNALMQLIRMRHELPQIGF